MKADSFNFLQVKCRLHHLKEFGKFLTTIENTTFIFDKEKHWFFKSTEEEPVETKVRFTKFLLCKRLKSLLKIL